MPPGRAMGALVEAAYQAQLDGVLATADHALAWARDRVPTAD